MPTVSVIIPTYNRPEFLRRAMRSVLNQSVIDLELIVVQNGQGSSGREVVEEFQRTDSRVRYLYQEEGDGGRARNLGILEARSPYVAFLDDDDEWIPTKLEKQIAVLDQHPDVGLVTCRAWYIDEAGAILAEKPDFRDHPSFKTLVTEGCYIWSLSSIVVRKTCFDRVGLFEARYQIANDYEFYLRVAQAYRMVTVQEPLFRSQWHRASLSRDDGWTGRETLSILKALRPAPELGVTHRTIAERLARVYYWMATNAMGAARFGEAARSYLGALRHDPFVGAKIRWGRITHPMYRTVRPYGALVVSGFMSVLPRGKKA